MRIWYGYIVNQLSGFGIGPDTGLPTTSDKCWEEFIKAHAKAGRFETKPFPLFKDLQTLFAGKAVGDFFNNGCRSRYFTAVNGESLLTFPSFTMIILPMNSQNESSLESSTEVLSSIFLFVAPESQIDQ